MAGPHKVAGLDIATVTGFACGFVGEVPTAGSIRFGHHRSDPPDVFAAAILWTKDFLAREKPDMLVVEAMLPPTAMTNHTSRAVRDRLAGLHGIILGVARVHGIGEIVSVDCGDVRAHFIGDRKARRDTAKRETIRRCQQLGWMTKGDNNAADACATWSYACGLIDPRWALQLSPLFNRKIAI